VLAPRIIAPDVLALAFGTLQLFRLHHNFVADIAAQIITAGFRDLVIVTLGKVARDSGAHAEVKAMADTLVQGVIGNVNVTHVNNTVDDQPGEPSRYLQRRGAYTVEKGGYKLIEAGAQCTLKLKMLTDVG
jgi:hypothetical protein